MHARVVLGVGKGVLFREVSSVQSVLIERERFHFYSMHIARLYIISCSKQA